MAGRCALCGRIVERLTYHHVIPRMRHRNKRIRNRFERDDLHRKVPLCRPCHRNLHVVLTEKELADEFNTLERLRAHPEIRRFTRWIRRRPLHSRVRPARRRQR